MVNSDVLAQLDYILHTRSLVNYESNYPGGVISFEVGWHLSYFMSFSDIARKVQSFADVDMRDSLHDIEDDGGISSHVRHCMDNHVDLFGRLDEVSLGWMGIEVVETTRLKSVLPAGYAEVANDLRRLQIFLIVP